ncbi:MAG TPA: DNA-binding response regulator, partial [Gammaproteobacteria bacterium]|nr:DNA-binding response regulator [Gammaproteobacteria bacterium]
DQDRAFDGEEAHFLADTEPYDAVVLDIGLPQMDGISVLERWRRDGRNMPVLILTARDRWSDKVSGIDAGADDYVTKPFHMEELLARVRALLRRSGGWSESVLRFAALEMDTRAQQVTVHGQVVELTAYEYRVLEYLAIHAGEVIAKHVLLDHLYDEDTDRDPNILEVFIKRLRNKLDPDKTLQPIETLRGRGYRLALERGNPSQADEGPA